MRWLMILLLVSLVAMLVAAAGVARHVWLQHKKLRQEPSADTGAELVQAPSQPPGKAKRSTMKSKN